MGSENGGLDVQRLIGAVAERHGILLKPDDAAFALVTINQLVLEAATEELLGKVEHAIADFEQSADRVQTRVGSLIGNEMKSAVVSIRGQLQSDIAAAGIQVRELVLRVRNADSRIHRARWISFGFGYGLVLFVAGILVGRVLQ